VGVVSDRVREMFELCSSVLFDVDDAGRLLIGNDESGSTQLYELAPDGHRSVLTTLGEPCWGRYLPGQRAVVVSADDGGTERAQLWLRRLDGATPGLEPLVTDPANIHTLLDLAPDRVIYATNRRNGVDFDVVLRTVSSGEEQVVWDGGGWFTAAALSPDGRYIALQRESLRPASTQLFLADLAAGTTAPITDAGQPGDWLAPRWLGSVVLAASDAGALPTGRGGIAARRCRQLPPGALLVARLERARPDVLLADPARGGLSLDGWRNRAAHGVERAAGHRRTRRAVVASRPRAGRRAGAGVRVSRRFERRAIDSRRPGVGVRAGLVPDARRAGARRAHRRGAERARLGRLRATMGVARRRGAAPRFGSRPGGHPYLAAVTGHRRAVRCLVRRLVRRVHGARRGWRSNRSSGLLVSTWSEFRRW
jgi:hypothetical protein